MINLSKAKVAITPSAYYALGAKMYYATVFAMLLMLTGCAAFSEFFSDNKFGLELAVVVGTAKYLENNPTKVADVIKFAERGIEFSESGVVVTADEFVELIKQESRFEFMRLSDQILVSALLDKIVVEITVDTVDLVEAKQVFEWILSTARMYQ